MNARGAPERIRGGHLRDEGDNLGIDARTTSRRPTRELGPVLAEAPAAPSQDDVRRHEDQSLSPAGPDSGQADPEQTIQRVESRPGHGSPVDCELLAQGPILKGALAMAAEQEGEKPPGRLPRSGKTPRKTHKAAAPRSIVAGRVRTQDRKMRRVMPQRTADQRRAA
jgi:hypothetical protein